MFWYICICVLTKLAERCLEIVPLQRFCEDYHRWFGRRSWLLPKMETGFTQLFTCGSWLEFTQSLFLLTSHPDLPHPTPHFPTPHPHRVSNCTLFFPLSFQPILNPWFLLCLFPYGYYMFIQCISSWSTPSVIYNVAVTFDAFRQSRSANSVNIFHRFLCHSSYGGFDSQRHWRRFMSFSI